MTGIYRKQKNDRTAKDKFVDGASRRPTRRQMIEMI